MKVVLTAPGWPPAAFANGIVTYVGLLREGLTKLGVESRILAGRVVAPMLDPTVADLSRGDDKWVRIQKLRDRSLWRLHPRDFATYHGARSVLNGLRTLRPEFVPDIVEMEESFGSAALVARRSGAPVVTRLHGPWFLNGAALGAPRDDAFRRRVAIEGKA
ncbi:MAG: glycosyltransferase, partial [Polyangiales bacterium]